MAAIYQAAVAGGRTDLWGTPLRFIEPESEHSSASAAEGVALAGGRVTNFTAGQGLVLMKEVLYVIAGKRLPAVFHVGARAMTSQALNIHAGHDDVMAIADTGWAILFARNAQEAADLAAIARRTAEATETPFIVAQDGFLTTHTLENVRLPEDELLREFVGDPRLHIRDLFDPGEALMTGVVQNQDSYMKGRIGQRAYTERIPAVLAESMAEWTRLTGRPYAPIQAYRTDDATEILVAMGTIADTALTVVDHLRSLGRAVGCIAVTAFRPFPADELREALGGARAVGIVERTDEPLAARNPLTREVEAALYERAEAALPVPRVLSFSAGLGSRDIAAGDLVAVFDQLAAAPSRHAAPLGPRHPPSARPRAGRRRPAAGRGVEPARPLDRRLRQRDHQQAHRDAGRRAVRQARPGLPALRIGEEGPADDLLPDRRGRAHPDPRRARPGGHGAAPRRLRVRASGTRWPAWSMAASSSSSRR